MFRLFTEVEKTHPQFKISLRDKVLLLGSCFSDDMASRMKASGFNILSNPFGTLYNPFSILSSIRRLDKREPFTDKDCVRMGAGSNLICSFSHHTSFARQNAEDFLAEANAGLSRASAFFKECDTVILTLGTSYVWKHDGRVVSNCLKLPSSEFVHEKAGVRDCSEALREIIGICSPRRVILNVSPVKHPGEGLHPDRLNKSVLLLSVDEALEGMPPATTVYFPGYEIVTDELRDYRWFGKDLCHPSEPAADYVWEKFKEEFAIAGEYAEIAENEKAARREAHRIIHL